MPSGRRERIIRDDGVLIEVDPVAPLNIRALIAVIDDSDVRQTS
jgi:hypothetical protein